MAVAAQGAAFEQVGERLQGVGENLPAGVNPEMGPIATGLGEVSATGVRGSGVRVASAGALPVRRAWRAGRPAPG